MYPQIGSAAADPPPHTVLAVGITTQNLQNWLLSNGVTVVIVIIAIALLMKALKGNAGQVLTVVVLSLGGLIFVALATVPGAAQNVGKWGLSLFGIGG